MSLPQTEQVVNEFKCIDSNNDGLISKEDYTTYLAEKTKVIRIYILINHCYLLCVMSCLNLFCRKQTT